MLKLFYRSIILTLLFALLLCGFYPFMVTVLGRIFFYKQTTGGFVISPDGKRVGAKLIGQTFTRSEYFHGRPSAAGNGYDATNSGGSNLGPLNPKLSERIRGDITKLLRDNPELKTGEIPTDLVTSSGSGLDPHISPASALAQVPRVAQSRNAKQEEIRKLVETHIQGPQLGFFGEATVNVLLLNLALDGRYPVQTVSRTH